MAGPATAQPRFLKSRRRSADFVGLGISDYSTALGNPKGVRVAHCEQRGGFRPPAQPAIAPEVIENTTLSTLEGQLQLS
jgi:hypothetical protein